MSARPHRLRWSPAAWLLATAIMTMLVLTVGPAATAQNRTEQRPGQGEADKGGGAVLCVWSLYLEIQAQTAICGLTRGPTDDAIDAAIIAMDEFIIANSSQHPTPETLKAFKQRVMESERKLISQRKDQICTNKDLGYFRSISPDQIQSDMKALLAVPREPVMNPCL
jgi:hypothetical protein